MRLPTWARRADPETDAALVAQVAGLRESIDRLVADTGRLAEWVKTHDGIHAQIFKHVMENMGENSSKAAADLGKFMYTKAKAQLIDKLFKLALTAAGTAIIAKIGLASLRIGGLSLGDLLP